MDKFEEVKKILLPICHERALSQAHKLYEIEEIADEMSTNLAGQICQLFPEPKPPNKGVIKCLPEWNSPKGLPKGWRRRVIKSSEGIDGH